MLHLCELYFMFYILYIGISSILILIVLFLFLVLVNERVMQSDEYPWKILTEMKRACYSLCNLFDKNMHF